MSEITRILSQIGEGDPNASAKLLPLVYEELRKLARSKLAQENPGHTLQATALVHEAYLRLVDQENPQDWNSKGHFFKSAGEAMRRILVENARRKQRVRHGGELRRVELADRAGKHTPDPATILAVDEAVAKLSETDEAAADVVKMHFFAGFTLEETADVLGIARATVYRHWAYARAYLRIALSDGDEENKRE